MPARLFLKVKIFVVILLSLCLVLSGCRRKVEGDKGYENLSDLANAEATADAFIESMQKRLFASGDGAAKFYITRGERGFLAEFVINEPGKKTLRIEFVLHDISYNSRVQRIVGNGGEVRFLYEELSFKLAASKKKSRYDGDPASPSRIYRVVENADGRLGVAGLLRLRREGAAVVIQLHQQL